MLQLAIQSEGKSLPTVVVPMTGVTIGRGESNDVVIPNLGVSRKHAQICQVDGEFHIKDLGSTNGIFLNGTKIVGSHPLTHGDKIQIGKFTITVSSRGSLTSTSVERPTQRDDTFVM
jgi:pSer/pThr/pTyr-binding forkhead associated (FHA) protein